MGRGRKINVILRFFPKHKYLSDITSVDTSKYRDTRLKMVGEATVLHEFVVISHIFTGAKQDWGYTDLRNSIADTRKPKLPDDGRDRRLSPGEWTPYSR